EYEWEQWVRKFEALLRNMYWANAVVHLETELAGHHTFIWESDSCHEPSDEPLQVRCVWSREGALARACHGSRCRQTRCVIWSRNLLPATAPITVSRKYRWRRALAR